MADLSGALSNIAGAITGFLGLTRHNRLRQQIRDTLGLFELAKPHPELAEATRDLGGAITHQSAQLLSLVHPSQLRRWDWGSFAVGAVLTAVDVWVEWLAWGLRSHWWGWIVLVVNGFFAFMFLVVSLQSLFQRRPRTG